MTTERRVRTAQVRVRSLAYPEPASPGSTDSPAPRVRRPLRADLAVRLRASQRVIRDRIEGRHALADVVGAVSETLDPALIAAALVQRAARWIPAGSWALVAADASGHLSVLAAHGVPEDLKAAACGIARWVMARGTEFTSADLGRDPRVAAAASVAALGLPLSCRGQETGALVALDRGPASRAPELPAAVRRALRPLLAAGAGALDAAVRLERAEGLSVTDDLTGLFNSRYLNQALRRETKRASRSGRPLSLLFLDLDDFKTVNDHHGHLAGSRALHEAAEVIRGSARETDIVARFGGDEFALVLPDTSARGAFAVGDRVRARVAAHGFLAAEGLDLHLTVSVGVATLPGAGSSAEELVRAADTAMYRIKGRGKNGIEAAPDPADK